MAQADVDGGDNTSRLTTDEKKELVQLRRDKRRLEMENEILKRAAAYFARENVLPNVRFGSVSHPAGVVRPHRDLDPVSGADFVQQAGDVGLGGRQADE